MIIYIFTYLLFRFNIVVSISNVARHVYPDPFLLVHSPHLLLDEPSMHFVEM